MTPKHRFDAQLRDSALIAGSLALTGVTLILAACTFSAPGGAQGERAPAQAVELTATATDLKFDPAVIQVATGQPVRLTFVNKGAIEHDWEGIGLQAGDVRILSAPAGLSQRLRDGANAKTAQGIAYAAAGPGQQMVVSFTPAQAGTYQVVCTVPGHKEAGMVGQLVVGDGSAPPRVSSQNQGNPTTSSLPAYADSPVAAAPAVAAPRLPQPQVAPALTARAPQAVSVEIETREVVGQMDDGVAYSYWTFGGTVPGPMVRVRQNDTVEVTLRNAPDSKVTHSIDLHATTGPGGGAKVTQVAPGETAGFRFQALNPGVYVTTARLHPWRSTWRTVCTV